MTEYLLVISTTPPDDAERIARILVESQKCARVNIVRNVSSIYHWQGEIHEDAECILIMKTEAQHKETLFALLKQSHPYEVPEFVVVPISWGSKYYLDWISASTK
ncbi:MAG: divalent-cation tolerance protein CutA [Candidatus Thorarchaeota archaeon]